MTDRSLTGVIAACVCLCVPLAASAQAVAAGQTLRDVVFSQYAERSSGPELARRLLTPFAASHLERQLAQSGGTLAGRPVNLAAERFIIYVPSQQPAAGYGLLVFVSPWQDAQLPHGWSEVLDRFGVIFVSAARSGNDESVFGRREPLALLAAENVIRQYPVDPERVYVSGFSGGSRIALRLALGYPDLFRGAILNAGSDPIGDAEIPLPPKDLFLKFQDSTRLVFVTGELDSAHVSDDSISVRSLHHWCVFGIDSFLQARVGHEVAAASALSRALADLANNAHPDPGNKLAACRSSIQMELDTKLNGVEAMITKGQKAAALRQLNKVDERFGGMAAPRSLELESKLR